jgi:hypothetical protein
MHEPGDEHEDEAEPCTDAHASPHGDVGRCRNGTGACEHIPRQRRESNAYRLPECARRNCDIAQQQRLDRTHGHWQLCGNNFIQAQWNECQLTMSEPGRRESSSAPHLASALASHRKWVLGCLRTTTSSQSNTADHCPTPEGSAAASGLCLHEFLATRLRTGTHTSVTGHGQVTEKSHGSVCETDSSYSH